MTAAPILEGIRTLSALVVGDICLDRWCRYDPSIAEPSRETGIPRIAVVRTEVTPGAAGTVANNLVALGAHHVAVLGIIGDDGFGYELKRALLDGGISPELAVIAPDLPTFTYTKLLNQETGIEDRPRVDFVNTRPLPRDLEEAVCRRLCDHWDEFDVVLVSDQAETEAGGLITAQVRETLSELAAKSSSKVVWVDSRKRGELFRNVLVKCNEDEARDACARMSIGLDLPRLRTTIGNKPLIVTHGGEGALVIDDHGEQLIRTRPVANPVDICGAGDSFSAGAALALAITKSPGEAAWFGNLVSSVTIMKKGTGTASPGELLEAERSRQ